MLYKEIQVCKVNTGVNLQMMKCGIPTPAASIKPAEPLHAAHSYRHLQSGHSLCRDSKQVVVSFSGFQLRLMSPRSPPHSLLTVSWQWKLQFPKPLFPPLSSFPLRWSHLNEKTDILHAVNVTAQVATCDLWDQAAKSHHHNIKTTRWWSEYTGNIWSGSVRGQYNLLKQM